MKKNVNKFIKILLAVNEQKNREIKKDSVDKSLVNKV